MIRAFIAVEISEAVCRDIAILQSTCQQTLGATWSPHDPSQAIQWMRPSSLHLTVTFLGNISESQVLEIERVLGDIGQRHHAFPLSFDGLGVFPNVRAPRILWVGIREGLPGLESLAEDVDEGLAARDFPREARPFRPHLTLARVKKTHRLFGTRLLETELLDHSASGGALQVVSLALIQSVLSPSGSVYSTRCRGALQAASSCVPGKMK